jgi:hypothetical protein
VNFKSTLICALLFSAGGEEDVGGIVAMKPELPTAAIGPLENFAVKVRRQGEMASASETSSQRRYFIADVAGDTSRMTGVADKGLILGRKKVGEGDTGRSHDVIAFFASQDTQQGIDSEVRDSVDEVVAKASRIVAGANRLVST